MVMEYVEGGTVLFGSEVTERRPVVEAVACNYFRDVVQVRDAYNAGSLHSLQAYKLALQAIGLLGC